MLITILLILSLPAIVVIFMSIKLGYKYRKSVFGKRMVTDRYRMIPMEGNLAASCYILTYAHRLMASHVSDRLIGTCLIRWITEGKVKVLQDPASPGALKLSFEQDFPCSETLEKDISEKLLAACGHDRILDNGELEAHSREAYKEFIGLDSHVESLGRRWLIAHHYMTTKRNIVQTEAGKEEACRLIGLRNYLQDIMDGKETTLDEALLKDYLVFGSLFGFSTRLTPCVARQFAPEFSRLAASLGLDADTLLVAINYAGRLSSSAIKNAKEKLATDGR